LQGDAAGAFRIAMQFLVINEKDRDFLIKYIFEKEREYLRQKKEL
jgi:c-di-GMP-binding flagellar brake protein YcgR